MTLRVQAVDPAYIQQVWPMVEGFIASAMNKGGVDVPETRDYTIEHIRGFLASGTWLLVVTVNEQGQIQGCGTLSFVNYPLHRVAFVTSMGGHLISNEDTMAQLTALLKQRGATKIQGYGRPAIVRLMRKFNFEPRSTLVEVLI